MSYERLEKAISEIKASQEKWVDLLLEVKTGQQVLQSRFDRHSEIYEQNFEKIECKLVDIAEMQVKDKIDLMEKISDNRLESVQGIERTKSKIAELSGPVSLLITGAWIVIKELFHK